MTKLKAYTMTKLKACHLIKLKAHAYVALLVLVAVIAASRPAFAAHTVLKAGADFSGVWQLGPHQLRHFDTQATARGGPLPPLKPEWMAEWQTTVQRKGKGMLIWDPAAHCLGGMPSTMVGGYPMEILMTPGRVTVLTENFNQTRRIWTDGRGHPPADELEYTFQGDSVGHWEGATLVVDTVGVREESVIDITAVPHSDQIHIIERIHLVGKDQLDWEITLEDPIVLAKPWTTLRHFVRSPPGEAVREYVCAENNQPDVYAPSPDDAKYEHPDPRLKTRQ